MTGRSGFLETDGARIYYEIDGDGPAVAMIHAGVVNLRMWDQQVAALSEDFRVIRYDTRGYGRTETGAVEFSNRADLAVLLVTHDGSFADALDLVPFDLENL